MSRDELANHIIYGLTAYASACRRDGITPHAGLAALLDLLAAPSGTERQTLAAQPFALNYQRTAQALDVSVRTVRNMVSDGRLRAVRCGRRVLIPVDSIGELLGGNG